MILRQLPDPADVKTLGYTPKDPRARFAEVIRLSGTREQWPMAMRVPHRVDFHTLLLTTAGSGRHLIDFSVHQCVPGTISWARPDQVQRVEPGAHLEVVALLVRRDALLLPGFSDRLDAHPPERLAWTLNDEDRRAVVEALERVEQDIAGERHDLVRARSTTILLELERYSRPHASSIDAPSARLVAGIRTAINTHFRQLRAADDYAALLGYSTRTLNRASVQVTGKSVKALIVERTMLEAKRLLIDSRRSVVGISHELGFSESTNFVAAFRNSEGVTPRQFRTRLLAVQEAGDNADVAAAVPVAE